MKLSVYRQEGPVDYARRVQCQEQPLEKEICITPGSLMGRVIPRRAKVVGYAASRTAHSRGAADSRPERFVRRVV